MTRKLASIKRIKQLSPIAGADRIELAQVDNWNVVVQKGRFQEHDLCLFVEVGSLIPKVFNIFNFLDKNADGDYIVQGKRIRNILSQGVCLTIDELPELIDCPDNIDEDMDFTALMNVTVYDKYGGKLPKDIIAARPSHLPSGDCVRIQNLSDAEMNSDVLLDATGKYDGEQTTIYFDNGILRLLSKNAMIDLNAQNELVRTLFACPEMIMLAQDYIVMCEYIGEGIRGNFHKIVGKTFVVFAMFDKRGNRLSRTSMQFKCAQYNIPYVQVLKQIRFSEYDSVEDLKADFAKYEGEYEGIVFNGIGSNTLFKYVFNE